MSKLIAAVVLLGSFTGSAIVFSAGCATHAEDELGNATQFLGEDADAGPLPKGSIVISEVFSSGGVTGAAYKNDYVELFNKTTRDISLDGLSLQTSTAADTNITIVVKLTGTIKASGYFLVQLKSSGGGSGEVVVDPDQMDDTDLGAKDGKVALVANVTAIDCGGSNPTLTPCTAAKYLDLVGWGNTTAAAGTGLAAMTSKQAAVRKDPCVADSGNNVKDFALTDVSAIAPQNSKSDKNVCPVKPPDAGPDSGPKMPAPPVREPEPGDESPFDAGTPRDAGSSTQSGGGDDSCAVGTVGSPTGFSFFAPFAALGVAILAIARRRKK